MENNLQPIHATIEQSERLRDAGWEKETYFAHCYKMHNRTWTLTYRNHQGLLPYPYDDVLYAPTLGEIELPEEVYVVKKEFRGYKIWVTNDFEGEESGVGNKPLLFYEFFESELDARIEAWIYFKKKEVQDES
jgi:hypothetical protein